MKKELVATTDKVERLTMIQDHEHEIDVMARYFLSYYYSGDKDKLKATWIITTLNLLTQR